MGTESLYDVLNTKVLFPNFPKDTQSQVCLSSHYVCGTHLPPADSVLTVVLYEPRCHTKLSCFQQSATCDKLQTFPSLRIVTLILESLVSAFLSQTRWVPLRGESLHGGCKFGVVT